MFFQNLSKSPLRLWTFEGFLWDFCRPSTCFEKRLTGLLKEEEQGRNQVAPGGNMVEEWFDAQGKNRKG